MTNCHRLKMVAQDGKMRETDVAKQKNVLTISVEISNQPRANRS